MLTSKNSIEILGKFQNLSFPVLLFRKENDKLDVHYNKPFEQIFLNLYSRENALEWLIEKVQDKTEIHWQGNLYIIDKIEEGQGRVFYLFNASKNSVNQSFLWLKHDLLNILNPIMGFSDVLSESENLDQDERELVSKIYNNSKKMYTQFEQIATLQHLNQDEEKIKAEEYHVIDFLKEIADKLFINEHITERASIRSSHHGELWSNIAHRHFRNALENQVIILLNWTDDKKVNFVLENDEKSISIDIIFGIGKYPANKMEEFKTVDNFIQECKPINKLQSEGLNYLLLSQLCYIMGGKVKLNFNHNREVNIKLQFPLSHINTKQSLLQLSDENEENSITHITKQKNSIPKVLLHDFKILCNSFDGLIILDEWEDFANKIEEMNQHSLNPILLQITEEIRTAVRTFNVVQLKILLQTCRNLFLEVES